MNELIKKNSGVPEGTPLVFQDVVGLYSEINSLCGCSRHSVWRGREAIAGSWSRSVVDKAYIAIHLPSG